MENYVNRYWTRNDDWWKNKDEQEPPCKKGKVDPPQRSSSMVEETRWHRQDKRRPYTWREFWAEAYQQLEDQYQRSKKTKEFTKEDVYNKAKAWWEDAHSSKDRE